MQVRTQRQQRTQKIEYKAPCKTMCINERWTHALLAQRGAWANIIVCRSSLSACSLKSQSSAMLRPVQGENQVLLICSGPTCRLCNFVSVWGGWGVPRAVYLAKLMIMPCVGVILKPCKPCSATPLCISLSKSTKEIPGRASTMRTCQHNTNTQTQTHTHAQQGRTDLLRC